MFPRLPYFPFQLISPLFVLTYFFLNLKTYADILGTGKTRAKFLSLNGFLFDMSSETSRICRDAQGTESFSTQAPRSSLRRSCLIQPNRSFAILRRHAERSNVPRLQNMDAFILTCRGILISDWCADGINDRWPRSHRQGGIKMQTCCKVVKWSLVRLHPFAMLFWLPTQVLFSTFLFARPTGAWFRVACTSPVVQGMHLSH